MKTTLHCTAGNSDKIYIVETIPSGDNLFLVNFAYGRRGATLNPGTKTNSPVSAAEAAKIFNKLVAEKRAKGYGEILDAASPGYPVSDGETAVSTGYAVQLLNETPESAIADLLANDNFAAQEKHDGRRMILVYENGEVTGSNRKALKCGIPTSFVAAVHELIKEHARRGNAITKLVLDGEAVGDVYFAFDLLEINETDYKNTGFFKRWLSLRRLLSDEMIEHQLCENIVFCDAAFNVEQKTVLFQQIKRGGGEGIVFKLCSSTYQAGRPASGGTQLKFKFYHEATCLVARHHQSKSSVSLQVNDSDGTLINIGNCKIPTNYDFPAIGELVEIRYLYAFPDGGSLYQPVYKGIRDDKQEADLYDSLKFKTDAVTAAV